MDLGIRYLHGVLLGLVSRVSRFKVSITPTKCVQCRLCEESCPYEAIHVPNAERPAPDLATARRRLAGLVLMLPVIVIFFGWIGGRLIARSTWRRRKDYEADPGACLACARCYDYCPEGRESQKEALDAVAG